MAHTLARSGSRPGQGAQHVLSDLSSARHGFPPGLPGVVPCAPGPAAL